MSKTKKIILIILVIVLLGALGLWYWGTSTAVPGSTNTGGFSVRNFFPFGNPDNASTSTDTGTGVGNSNSNQGTSTNATGNVNVPIAKLRKISDSPVSGAVIWNSGTTSIVRFVDKATGNVYEARSDSSIIRRLTNETIPKVTRSYWLKDGSGFLAQRLDSNLNILTSFIKLKQNNATTSQNYIPFSTVISDLPVGIQEITISPDSKKIFYYIAGNTASGYISNPDGTSPSMVFSNSLTEWLPQWFSANNISLATKASGGAGSYGFILNTANKTLTRSYNNILGVSSLVSPDSKHAILGNGVDPISLFDLSNSNISPLSATTLPEKCVWDVLDPKFIFCGLPRDALSGNYPDSWYQGTVSTSDLLVKINVFDNYSYILSNPIKDANTDIDVSNIQTSSDASYLIFTNKKDSSLWILNAK